MNLFALLHDLFKRSFDAIHTNSPNPPHYAPNIKRRWGNTAYAGLFAFVGLLTMTAISVPFVEYHFGNKATQAISGKDVLAAETIVSPLDGTIVFSIPAVFKKPVTFENGQIINGDTIINGSVTAPNILYSVAQGKGIGVTTGQNPTITNTGVLSLQGQTGDVTLTAGSGISINGTTITNTNTNSPTSQNEFATISDGTNSFTAGSANDTVTFLAGSGINLTTDTTNKKITIAGVGGSGGGVTSLAGTANQIFVNGLTAAQSGGIALTLAQDIGTTSTPTFGGLIANGSVSLGNATSDTITPTGRFAGSLVPSTTDTYDLGTSSLEYNNLYVKNIISTGTLAGFFQRNLGVIAPTNISDDLVLGGTASSSAKFQVSGTNGAIVTAGGITSSGTITFSGLGTGVVKSTAGVLSATTVNLASSDVSGVLPVSNGGTGTNTFTQNGVLYGNGTNAVQTTASGSANQVLAVNVQGVPEWMTISAGGSGACSNCLSSSPNSTQTIQPTGNVTGLTIQQTSSASPSADIFSVTNSTGTVKFLQIDSNGNVILNNNDLQLGGNINMKIDDTNLANIVDTFVYDTSTDIDAGAWTNNGNAQASSWYNETVSPTGNCVLGLSIRCGTRPFPKRVIIVVRTTAIYLYDAQNDTLWMAISTGSGLALGSTTLSSVYALNGVLYIGTTSSGLIAFDFINDKIFRFDYNAGSGGRAQFLGTLAQRNTNLSYEARQSWGQIASDKVNGVFARVINGKTYIAVSTLGGASVIDLSDQRTIRYIDN